MKKLLRILWIIVVLAWAFLVILKTTTRFTPAQPTPTTMANPASVYCEQQSGTLEIVTDASGWQSGICHLVDGTTCDEWAYFKGECPSTGMTNNINAFVKLNDFDSPYSGVVEYEWQITVNESLRWDFVMWNEEWLKYCNEHKNEWGSTKCPTIQHILIHILSGYFDNKLVYNKNLPENYIEENTYSDLGLWCLVDWKIITTSFDWKYMTGNYSIQLFSAEDTKMVIENVSKGTLFKFKIYKTAYNIPGRDVWDCETTIEKVEIIK